MMQFVVPPLPPGEHFVAWHATGYAWGVDLTALALVALYLWDRRLRRQRDKR